MAANYVRTEKIELKNGKLYRMMYCQRTGAPLLVAKLCEDGTQVSRNIEYRGLGGWCYAEPGQHIRRYYENYIAEVDPWANYGEDLSNFCVSIPSESDREKILTKYPNFKWVMAKAPTWTTADIFHALPLWKKEARLMETLCSMGCDDLALNGSLYRCANRWDIVKAISRNPDYKFIGLENIRLLLKYGTTWEEVSSYRDEIHVKWNYVTFEEWRYLKNQTMDPREYNDYRAMCKEVGHDFNDPYWHYPKDLKKQHDKVLKELTRKRKADEAIRRAKLKALQLQREKEQQDTYTKFVKMMAKYTGTLTEGQLQVFVPQSVESVQKQAKALHQCLITCDYIQKVVNKKCLLVFIYRNGKPYATAELVTAGRKFKLGQFNCNQLKEDYLAPESAKSVLLQWAQQNCLKVAA